MLGQQSQAALNLLACWITSYIVVFLQYLMRQKNMKCHLINLKISNMRSMLYQSHFHSTQLIFSNSQHYLETILNAKNKELHLVQLQSLLLNTKARMYLYNTPRDTIFKDSMFQSLRSTSIWNAPGLMPNTSNSYLFMCFRALCSTQTLNSCAAELTLNTIIKSLMCFRARTQHKH